MFGQDILKKSKVMQETRQLNAEKTAGLITGVRGSEYLFRQIRTGLNNELGYSPLASQRKVEAFREKVMVAKKEDWDFQKMNIFTHKQGKSKGLPTERGSFLICFGLGHYLLNTRSICLNHSDHSCGKSRLFPGLFAHFPNLVSLL